MHRRVSRRRLLVERLEQRQLLAQIDWISDQSGDWSNPANWSGGVVPGAADDVTIDRAAEIVVTISDQQVARSVVSRETVRLIDGRLEISQPSQIDRYEQSGGELSISRQLDVISGSWEAGAIRGAGTIQLAESLALTGSADKTLGADIVNAGTILQSDVGDLLLERGALLTNDGTYQLSGGGGVAVAGTGNGAAPKFVNSGLLQKSGDASEIELSGDLTFEHQQGTIDVVAGTLKLNDLPGRSTGGTFNAQDGGKLEIIGNESALTSGTYGGAGDGVVELSGGVFGLGFGVRASLNFAPGLFQWTGGAITADNEGSITLAGADTKFLASQLNNSGRIVHTGSGDLDFTRNNRRYQIINLEDGVYELATDADLLNGYFTNRGVFQKTTAGTSSILFDDRSAFLNDGLVEVTAGTLSVDARISLIGNASHHALPGDWRILNGSKLEILPQALREIRGEVTLSGVGASFPQLETINAVADGSLSVLDGAVLDIVPFSQNRFANFISDVRVGSSSVLNITGNYETLPRDGNVTRLITEVAGTRGSGNFGQVNISGRALLADTFEVEIAPAAQLQDGDQYSLVTFDDRLETTFDTVVGLDSGLGIGYSDTDLRLFVGGTPDLVVTNVTGPAHAAPGELVELTWTVMNQGQSPAVGPWRDALGIVADYGFQLAGLDEGDEQDGQPAVSGVVLANETMSGAGLVLAAGESQQFSTMIRVPGDTAGPHRWSVVVNARNDLIESEEARDNNSRLAEQTFDLVPNSIPVDAAPLAGAFAMDSPEWFQVQTPPRSDVVVSLDLIEDGGVTELYIAENYVPTRSVYDSRYIETNSPDVTLVAEGGEAARTYYVTAFPRSLTAEPAEFSIVGRTHPLQLDTASPSNIGNEGTATLTVVGLGLRKAQSFRLVGPDGTINATQVIIENSQQVFAEFPVDGIATGEYRLEALDGEGGTVELATPISVGQPLGMQLRLASTQPEVIRVGRDARVRIFYENAGNTDLPLPFISIASTGQGMFRYQRENEQSFEILTLLAPMVVPGSTVLPPGARGEVEVFYRASAMGTFEFDIQADSVADPTLANFEIDWEDVSNASRPAGVSDAAWQNYVDQERARYGSTYGELYEFLESQMRTFDAGGATDLAYVEGQWIFGVDESITSNIVRGAGGDGAEAESTNVGAAVQVEVAVGEGPVVANTGVADGVQNVHVLTIGAEDYDGLPRWSDLPATISDSAKVETLFKGAYNVPTANIQRLDDTAVDQTDDLDATKVSNAIKNTVSQGDADDLVVVWIGGHGSCSLRKLRDGTDSAAYTQFKGGRMTAANYETAFRGANSKVLFVLDTCHARAITADITNPNVVAVSSTDWGQLAGDGFFTPAMVEAMAYNPDGDFLSEVREVATDVFEKRLQFVRRSAHANALKALEEGIRTPYSSVRDNGYNVGALLTREDKRAFRAYNQSQAALINDNGNSSVQITRPDSKRQATKSLGPLFREGWFTGRVRVRSETTAAQSFDPNAKLSTTGVGDDNFIRRETDLPYTVLFENDPLKATLPAQVVEITDVLDENLDLNTFELGSVGFGDTVIDIPPGRTAFSDVRSIESEGFRLDVRVEAELDFATRTVTWTFTSLDPLTQELPEEALAGFLPVNDASGSGEGFVDFRIRPRADLATGDEIRNVARIVFDLNEAIETELLVHTIDNGAPESQVASLPALLLDTQVNVDWSGQDDAGGSGLVGFDVYVSVDGRGYSRWLENTTETSAVFTAEDRKRYRFFSVAHDATNFVEQTPAVADAETLVNQHPWRNPRNRFDVNDDGFVTSVGDVLVTINEVNNRNITDSAGRLPLPPAATRFSPFYDVNGDDQLTPVGDVLPIINFLNSAAADGEGGDTVVSFPGIDFASERLAPPLAEPLQPPLITRKAASQFGSSIVNEPVRRESKSRLVPHEIDQLFFESEDLLLDETWWKQ